jgi:hypothetical protein
MMKNDASNPGHGREKNTLFYSASNPTLLDAPSGKLRGDYTPWSFCFRRLRSTA